jgi:hypothetical protein
MPFALPVALAPLSRVPEAVAETDLTGPALLVVGEVVRLADRIAWFATPEGEPIAPNPPPHNGRSRR